MLNKVQFNKKLRQITTGILALFMTASSGISKILNQDTRTDRSQMHLEDLDIVYTIHDDHMKNVLNSIMKALDSVSLSGEEGYRHFIQLIFYNFATKFQTIEKAEFLTPLPIIDFLS